MIATAPDERSLQLCTDPAGLVSDQTTHFGALLRRDAHVSARELPFFLVRTCLQPLLFVVVFGYLLPRMGFVARGYGAALLPGILAVSLALSSVQAVALPMVADFGFTREIDDRVLAPLPVWAVGFEKIVAGAVQALIAALIVFPILYVVPATTVRVRRRASRASSGGSVPTTATATPSTSASFSRSTPSSEPNPSTCA